MTTSYEVVTPVKTGVQASSRPRPGNRHRPGEGREPGSWIPAFVGMTKEGGFRLFTRASKIMDSKYILTGRIVRGAGKASYFTELDWVQQQCHEKLRFRPYPGTLNIEVDEDSLDVLLGLQRELKIELRSPDARFCNAQSVPATLGHVRGAIIIPAKDVNIHGQNIIEMIAPVSLKETLCLKEGDEVIISISPSMA